MSWDEIASPHIGCRCVLKDTRNLRCVDHAVTLVLPREAKATVTGPPPYRRPDTSEAASPEQIAFRKREALAAVEHAKQRRTTVEEEPA